MMVSARLSSPLSQTYVPVAVDEEVAKYFAVVASEFSLRHLSRFADI